MRNIILTICAFFFITSGQLFSANIIWEKIYPDNELSGAWFTSKMLKLNDKIYIFASGLHKSSDSIGYREDLVVSSYDLEGNLLNRKIFLENYSQTFINFQFYDNMFQLCYVTSPGIAFAGPAYVRYLDLDFNVINTYKLEKYIWENSTYIMFDKDSIKQSGFAYGGGVAVASIYNRELDYLGGLYVDTTGFNYPQKRVPYAWAVSMTNDGNMMWTIPYIDSELKTIYKYLLVKTDNRGSVLWTTSIDSTTTVYNNSALLNKLIEDESGNIISAGSEWEKEGENGLIVVVKLSPNGEMLWSKKIEKERKEILKKIRVISNDRIVLLGTNKSEDGTKNFTLRILSKDGHLLDKKVWSLEYTLHTPDIVEKDNGNLLFSGYIYHNSDTLTGPTTDKLYLAELAPDYSSRAEDNVEIKGNIEAFPNPASGYTNISYSLSAPGSVSISIHDILGRKVKSIFDGYKSDGSHSEHIGLTTLPAGVYYIALTAGGERRAVRFSVNR